jgi:hypothetical protein
MSSPVRNGGKIKKIRSKSSKMRFIGISPLRIGGNILMEGE